MRTKLARCPRPKAFEHAITREFKLRRFWATHVNNGKRALCPLEPRFWTMFWVNRLYKSIRVKNRLTCVAEKKNAAETPYCLALTESIRLNEPKCLHWEMLTRLGRWPFINNSNRIFRFFLSHVNGSPRLLRKCRNSCLPRGNSGRWVTWLAPGTSFLLIKRYFS